MTKKELFLRTLCILSIALVLLSPAACTMYNNKIMLDAMKMGFNPALVKCTLGDAFDKRNPLCQTSEINR